MTSSKSMIAKKHKVWEIQSQCEHDGKPVWTEEIVEKFVKDLDDQISPKTGKKILKRYAWCNHNQDKYLQSNIDELKERDPMTTAKVGDSRPAHIHLMLEFENAVYNTQLHKKLIKYTDLPIGFIQEPKAGYNQYLAMITYLTHCRERELAKGKHRYNFDEVHCNFNYEETVSQYLSNQEQEVTHKHTNQKKIADDMINRLVRGELTIEGAKTEAKNGVGFSLFLRHEKEFRQARNEYIKRQYEMEPRINFYYNIPPFPRNIYFFLVFYYHLFVKKP